MEQIEIYRQAYNILENVTPLRLDCGNLCRKACCQNPEYEEAGMYLFPGEENIYSRMPQWLTVRQINWNPNPERKIYLATCNGTCDRSIRPLACRIFPLTPYIGPSDILQIRMDIRAKPICPLAQQGRQALNPEFIQKVRAASQILMTDPDIKDFIKELSAVLDDYEKLLWNTLL